MKVKSHTMNFYQLLLSEYWTTYHRIDNINSTFVEKCIVKMVAHDVRAPYNLSISNQEAITQVIIEYNDLVSDYIDKEISENIFNKLFWLAGQKKV